MTNTGLKSAEVLLVNQIQAAEMSIKDINQEILDTADHLSTLTNRKANAEVARKSYVEALRRLTPALGPIRTSGFTAARNLELKTGDTYGA
jgi:hypothetical protein